MFFSFFKKKPFSKRKNKLKNEVIGISKKVPLRTGKKVRYINFDNAASTPPLKCVLKAVNDFAGWYSSVHRGSGFKSFLSTEIYEITRKITADFAGYDFRENTVIFVKNTTEAINKLSYRLSPSHGSIVLTSFMEHHSNDLPWRFQGRSIPVQIDGCGRLSLNDLEQKLKKYAGKISLVAITGASNVTGFINPVHKIARLAHRYGAKILVDGAQLIPHRPFKAKENSHPEHIDFLAFSAHKIYAPFGTGVLIGPEKFFARGKPELTGGGTILSVTKDSVYWAEPPEKEEAGSPNVIGAVALARALKFLQETGMDKISKQEEELTEYLLKSLNKLEDIKIYGESNPQKKDRLGVISFSLKGFSHPLLAALLSYEAGIGVRNGCFCAHPYVHKLLKLKVHEIRSFQKKIREGNLHQVPGFIRVSLGIYNDYDEVDQLISSLNDFIKKGKQYYLEKYRFIKETGQFFPQNLSPDFNKFFKI